MDSEPATPLQYVASPNERQRSDALFASEPVPPQADDLEAIRNAVVDAAGVSAGLWVSYLFALFYLLIAAGGVTHRDLLLSNTITLPFLSVQLPLRSFSALGPGMFLVVHAYVLLHVALLASKVAMFDARLRAQVKNPKARTRLRRQLPINPFVQFLAGPEEVRRGTVAVMLHLIAWTSLVIGPVGLPVYFELQFLPAHDTFVSWLQRFAVIADLMLLWMLWPKIVGGTGRWELRRSTGFVLGLVSIVAVVVVFAIATFHAELMDRRFGFLAKPHTWLVGGEVDEVLRKQKVVWSDRLVLPSFDVIDHAKFDTDEKIAAAPEMASLRGRRLDEAVLFHSILRKVDFTGSNLQGADLLLADLQRANLDSTQLQGARLGSAQLQGATFNIENLRGSDERAQLQGANLSSASLQGASLIEAQLQGANLSHAQLQGANLTGANLTGVNLKGANLQLATLDKAQLQDANLDNAQMQGASLSGADLRGASLRNVFVWRADMTDARLDDARVQAIESSRSRPCENHPGACDWASPQDDLKRIVDVYVPESAFKARLGFRIDQQLDASRKAADDTAAKVWTDHQGSPSDDATYEAQLAQRWTRMVCEDLSEPFVAAALIDELMDSGTSPFAVNGPEIPDLAGHLLTIGCKGAEQLPESARQRLALLKSPALQAAQRGRQP